MPRVSSRQIKAKFKVKTVYNLTNNMDLETVVLQFSEYLKFEKRCTANTVKTFTKRVREVLKYCKPPPLFEQVEEYISKLKRSGRSPSYINHVITALNCYSRYAHLDFEDRLNRLRIKDNKTPDPNDLLSPEEIKKIIEFPFVKPKSEILKINCTEILEESHQKYSLLFELIYKTGCRSGEAIKLRVKDIAFQNGSLTFYDTKTGGDRTVAIPPDMEERLKIFTDKLSSNDFLFTGITNGKQPITQEMVNRMFKQRAKSAGIERATHVHCLRHSMITHLLVNGAPLSTVQAIVGHKRLSTTQLYTHIVVENQREAMLMFNPLIRQGLSVKDVIKRFEDFIKGQKLAESGINYRIQHTSKDFTFQIIKE